MLVLSAREVEKLLDLGELVEAVAAAMADLSAGRVSMPPRVAATTDAGLLAAMPASLPSAHALTTKLVTLFPGNRDRPTHQAIICCFDADNGTPIAVMDGEYITATRTAAGSALASRLLAVPGADSVAIIGTGVQALSHARALSREFPSARLLVAGREPANVQALVDRLAGEGIEASAAESIEAAARACAIVCLATHAAAPVIRREWLRPGTHVNSVGYNTAGEGEVDQETVRDAVVVVESRAAALAPPPAGALELQRAIASGVIGTEHIKAELGELVSGAVTARSSASEITLYKSVGVAVQDAAAAALMLREAQRRGIGRQVDI